MIDEPTQLIQNGIAVQEVRCSNNGICDGEITFSVAPIGGIPPYSYSVLDYGNNIPFGPISSDSTFSGLCTDFENGIKIKRSDVDSNDTLTVTNENGTGKSKGCLISF